MVPGHYQPLVTTEQFEAAQRGNSTGKAIGKDLLSGRVRCGNCGRRIAIDSNGRNEGIYRCKHRGKGCSVAGRSAKGLHRAAKLAMRVLAEDQELQDAIRQQLCGRTTEARTAEPSRSVAVAKLRQKRQKLLDLYYADKISPTLFAEQESALTRQIEAIEGEAAANLKEVNQRSILADQFEQVAILLRTMDTDALWNAANDRELKVLVNEIIESVIVYADRLQVVINGAPPITVAFSEVGLREMQQPPFQAAGTEIDVSKVRDADSHTGHWRLV